MKKILFAILIIFTTSSSQHVDCIGGSITKNGYPGYANDLMEENGYAWRIHNYGVPGASVVANNPYSEKDEYDEVVCREAQVVVILLGANDWQWYFEDTDGSRKIRWRNGYVKLVQEFKKNSIVILGTLTYRISVNGDVTDANNTMDAMTVVVRSIAAEYGLGVIDFQTALGTDPAHFWPEDGLHPSDLGSEKMGIAAYEHLKDFTSEGRNINNCNDLSIKDEDYWEAVEDYENQKPSLFNGCSF